MGTRERGNPVAPRSRMTRAEMTGSLFHVAEVFSVSRCPTMQSPTSRVSLHKAGGLDLHSGSARDNALDGLLFGNYLTGFCILCEHL